MREKYYLLNKKVRLISQANRTRNARAHHPLEPFFSPAGGSMFCLLGANFFCIRNPLAQIPAPTAQLERDHISLQLGSQTASSINARTLASRPILRSRLANASTVSFTHRFDCTPPIPAPAAFSAVRHSAFSASPNLTIAAGRRKQQGAPASAQRPVRQRPAPRQPPGAQQGSKQQRTQQSARLSPLRVHPFTE